MLSSKQGDLHTISQILVKPKFYTSDFAWYRPIYGKMVNSNITCVIFSEVYCLCILVGYLVAIYTCLFSRGAKKIRLTGGLRTQSLKLLNDAVC